MERAFWIFLLIGSLCITGVLGDIGVGNAVSFGRGLVVHVTVLRAREAIYYRLSCGRPIQPIADTLEDRHRVGALFLGYHCMVDEPVQRLV